jgi:hypothetical protein
VRVESLACDFPRWVHECFALVPTPLMYSVQSTFQALLPSSCFFGFLWGERKTIKKSVVLRASYSSFPRRSANIHTYNLISCSLLFFVEGLRSISGRKLAKTENLPAHPQSTSSSVPLTRLIFFHFFWFLLLFLTVSACSLAGASCVWWLWLKLNGSALEDFLHFRSDNLP